jgi:hypothetical protein
MLYQILRTNQFVLKRMAKMAEQYEQLVDVLNDKQHVLHTYPVTDTIPITDEEIKEKAVKAAKFTNLVPGEEAGTLTTRLHVSRRGQLQPYGNKVPADAESAERIRSDISDRAYFLWQNDIDSEKPSDYYWRIAEEEHLKIRSYTLWEQEGRSEDPDAADRYWYSTKEYEKDIF